MTPVTPPPCPVRLAATMSAEELKHGKERSVTTASPLPLAVEGTACPSPPLIKGVVDHSPLPQDMSNILSTPPEMKSREITPSTVETGEFGLRGGASTGATPTCSPVGVAHSTPKVCNHNYVESFAVIDTTAAGEEGRVWLWHLRLRGGSGSGGQRWRLSCLCHIKYISDEEGDFSTGRPHTSELVWVRSQPVGSARFT